MPFLSKVLSEMDKQAVLVNASAQIADKRALIGDKSGNPLASVTRDATSGIYCPSSLIEWQTFLTVMGLSTSLAPFALWLCQEANGNLIDPIGGFNGTPANAPSYQNNQAGWSRFFVGGTDGGSQNFSNTSVSLPNASDTSIGGLAYANVQAAPAALRTVIGFGSGTICTGGVNVTPRARVDAGANSAVGTVSPIAAVRPWWVQNSNPGGPFPTLSTNQEDLAAAGAALAGQQLRIGRISNLTPNCQWGYVAWFRQSAADTTTAQRRTILQGLGWGIPW